MMATHDRLITVASPSGQFPGETPLPGTDHPVPALRIVSSTSEEIMVPPRGASAARDSPQEQQRGGSLGAGPSALPPPALHNPPSTARSLYVGKLHPAVTEAMLHSIFATLGPVEEVKIIRDKLSGVSAGYGFVTYQDHRVAELALHSFNGRMMYGQEVRVNWAAQREQKVDTTSHFHIFVGDLAPEINDRALLEAFSVIPTCSDARVVWDHTTGRSKGYGFVSYSTREGAERAIREVGGTQIGSRVVRCGWAHHKRDTLQGADYLTIDQADPTNCNVYIGNISPEVEHEELRAIIASYGPLVSMRMYRKEGYGFAEFENHHDAVRAILGLNGHLMGGKLLRMAWGRYQNRQAGQQGAFAAAAAAAAATAGMAGSMPGMGLMMEQQTAGYLLPPGMLGGAHMPQMLGMGTPPGSQLQGFAPPGASPSGMLLSPGARLPTRRASLTPPRPLGLAPGQLSPGQLGGLGGAGVPGGMQLGDPSGSGRIGGGVVEQLQQGMAGLSLMGGQGVAPPPPPPPPQAQMMLEGGMMVPQGMQGMHPGMLPPGAVPMPMTGEWTEGGMYYPFYYTDYS